MRFMRPESFVPSLSLSLTAGDWSRLVAVENRTTWDILKSKKFVGQFQGKKEEDLTETQKSSYIWQMLKSHKEKGVYEDMDFLYADIWALYLGSIETSSASLRYIRPSLLSPPLRTSFSQRVKVPAKTKKKHFFLASYKQREYGSNYGRIAFRRARHGRK